MAMFQIKGLRRFIPFGEFLIFVGLHYVLALGQVPAKNQIPATLGASGLTAMTISMVLAARLPAIDTYMVGPGRAYRLHRWLGYSSLLVIGGHWLTASSVGSGLIPDMAEFAGRSGRYATILMIVLIAVSVLKFVPYHIWKLTHLLMGPIYAVAVYHTFFSQIPVKVGSLLWWILVIISSVGMLAFARTVARHFRRKPVYVVSEIQHVKNGIDFWLKPKSEADIVFWRPGQFATLSIDSPNLTELHPFTICCSSTKKQMRFVVSCLGDYTSRLKHDLKLGDTVRVHDISGEFIPEYMVDRRERQVWVAAGVGITPFIAAIDTMVPDHGPPIDLVYCYRSLEWALNVEWLAERAEELPQLRVHFVGKDMAGSFGPDILSNVLDTGWKDGLLYVCGPDKFIDLVCDAWRFLGGRPNIRVELFEFRKVISLKTMLQKRASIKRSAAVGRPRDSVKTFG